MNVIKPILLGLAGVSLLFFGISFVSDALEPARWYFLLAAAISLSFLPQSRVARAGFGTAILAVLVFFVTQLLSGTGFGNKRIDLTEDKRYTLTEGSRAILSELSEPVTINYYVTRDVDGTPASFKRHIPRVDSFLREIAGLAKDDLVTLNFIDPQPNTDEEDAARLDQIQQIPVTQDDNLLFGASISSLDKKTVIPAFDPRSETQLEYQVVSAIAEVTTRTPPVVGLISAHNMAMGGQSGRGWGFYQVMSRNYDIIDLGMTPTTSLEGAYETRNWGDAPSYLDPEKIPVLLLVHPAGITPEAEFAIDQYLLRGGTVIACVDPLSMVAQQSGRSQIPGMPPQGGTPPTSTLPKLFEKHRINFDTSQAIVDRPYAQQGGSALVLTKDAMPAEDAISLSEIDNLILFISGAFTEGTGPNAKRMGPGLEVSRLVETSRKYSMVDTQAFLNPQGSQELRFALGNLRESDQRHAYVTHLSGTFETAFPDGSPATKDDPGEKEEDKEESEDEKEEKSDEDPPALTTGTSRGNLFLFADSDFLYDGPAYQVARFGNSSIINPSSDNGAFVLNLIDQAVGSKHLIGARARSESLKPFKVLKEKEAEFEQKAGEELEKLEAKRAEASRKINEIRSQVTKNNQAQMTNEFREEIARHQQEEINASKSIREKKKEYQAQIDSLKAGIFWKSILYVPLGVLIIGLAVFAWRKSQTNAR